MHLDQFGDFTFQLWPSKLIRNELGRAVKHRLQFYFVGPHWGLGVYWVFRKFRKQILFLVSCRENARCASCKGCPDTVDPKAIKAKTRDSDTLMLTPNDTITSPGPILRVALEWLQGFRAFGSTVLGSILHTSACAPLFI